MHREPTGKGHREVVAEGEGFAALGGEVVDQAGVFAVFGGEDWGELEDGGVEGCAAVEAEGGGYCLARRGLG